MITDAMKDRPRKTNHVDKVCTSYLLFLCFHFILCFIGKLFWNNGDRYEGKFKDGKEHGQGKKQVITL